MSVRGTTAGTRRRHVVATVVAAVLGAAGLIAVGSATAGATAATTEGEFVTAGGNAAETQIDLAGNGTITCTRGLPTRNSPTPVTGDGHGFTPPPSWAGSGAPR